MITMITNQKEKLRFLNRDQRYVIITRHKVLSNEKSALSIHCEGGRLLNRKHQVCTKCRFHGGSKCKPLGVFSRTHAGCQSISFLQMNFWKHQSILLIIISQINTYRILASLFWNTVKYLSWQDHTKIVLQTKAFLAEAFLAKRAGFCFFGPGHHSANLNSKMHYFLSRFYPLFLNHI